MSLRRAIQLISLALFLFFLIVASTSFGSYLPVDSFLQLDPTHFMGTLVSARYFSLSFLTAILVLLITLVLGRIFCGYICPLGTTLDGTDKIFCPSHEKRPRLGNLRPIKYYIIAFLFGAAVLGVSLIFIAAPLSLITRFYGLVVYPVFALFADGILSIIQPLADRFGISSLVFAQIKTPRFATQFFILVFFAAIFASARFSPRFWCRYLCPSGALLALVSRKPLLRRRVTEDCTDCGKCVESCPMGAIPEDPCLTLHEECIVCRTCEKVCPVDAVAFTSEVPGQPSHGVEFSQTRRRFIASGLTGAVTAAISLTGLKAVSNQGALGQVADPRLIRPPGALPEKEFLSRCVRCGECMAACPTNTLQPIWFQAGFIGLFSPALNMRRGPCDPECIRCGEVCPTNAITNLLKNERIWAKLGTAVILRHACLAWEHQKKCLVCDEVCPFDAVVFKDEPEHEVPVPHVIEDRCAGCGYCEYFCPVQNQAAIVVTPMGALRQSRGSYEEEAKRQGLKLVLRPKDEYGLPESEGKDTRGPAPGFTE